MSALDPMLIEAVKRLEGFTPVAKWDYQQWTNGYGTRAHFPHEHITAAEAEKRLDAELAGAQASVDSLEVQMPPGIRKALTDLTFNAGFGWSHAGLGMAVRHKDWVTAKEHLLQYDIAGGRVNTGLEERRKEEASWFDEPGQAAEQALVTNALPYIPPSPPPVASVQGPQKTVVVPWS